MESQLYGAMDGAMKFVKGDAIAGLIITSINIIGIKGNAVYSLVASKTAIKKDTDGLIIDGEEILTVSVLRRQVGSSETVPAETTSGEYYVTYQQDDRNEVHFAGDNTYDTPEKQQAVNEKVVFRLYTKMDKSLNWAASNRVLNDVETVYVVSDGERGRDGISSILADLDNELDSVPLTYEGLVDAGDDEYVTASTVFSVFYGLSEIECQDIKVSSGTTEDSARSITSAQDQWTNIIGTNVQVRRDDNILTFRVKGGWDGFPDDPLEIRLFILARAGTVSQTCKLAFTLAGVRAGSPGEAASLYSLYPSTSFLSKKEDGEIEPGNISCQVLKKNGKTVSEVNLDTEGLKIIYTTDDNETAYRTFPTGGISGDIVQGIDKYIKFVLVSSAYTSTSTPPLIQSIDVESVPVVKDGVGAEGRGVLAKCDYWCANPYESPSVAGFPDKHTIGASPTGWTMDGEYFEADDPQMRHKQTASNTIPLPDEVNTHLWKWEKYWYSDGNHYETNISLVTNVLDEVTAIETWYMITVDTEAAEAQVRSYYNEVTEGVSLPSAHFTNLANVTPRELGVVGEDCEVRWQFHRVVFAQKDPQYLGLEIVDRYYKPLMDIDILKGMFGEANVQGKKGAYLREFLGVMGTNPSEHAQNGEFYNYDVKAFMNATPYWYKDPTPPGDEYKGRVMFAAGVTNLGSQTGQNNYSNWDDIENNANPQGVIDINRFSATTVIWEFGELDCKMGNIEGTIHAWEGSFGGGPDSAGCVKINSEGIEAVDSNDDTTFVLGETGATFNGIVNAKSLHVDAEFIGVNGLVQNSSLVVSPEESFAIQSIAKNTRYRYLNSFLLSPDGLILENVGNNANVRTKTLLKEGEIEMSRWDTNGTYDNDSDDIISDRMSITPQKISFKFNMQGNENTYEKAELGYDSSSDKVRLRVQNGEDYTEVRTGYLLVNNFTNGEFIANGGKVYATAFYETSDAREKNVGEPLTDVLDKLEQIPTVYYKWKDHRDDERHIGTLAQSLLDVFPETVGGTEDAGYKVDYAKLSIIALAAIKELKSEVDALKDEITKLKGTL